MYKTPNISMRVGVILGVTAVFIAGLAAFLFWYLGGQEKAATQEANKFISALVRHDPSAAPRNGDDYVRGVWQAYRRVDDAKLIKTRQKSSNHSGSTSGSSWWVADMLLHTGRGTVVLELAFESNHLDPKTQIIDQLYELTPDRIPGGTLDEKTLARVASDQRERGSKPEDDITLSVSGFESPPVTVPRVPVRPVRPPKFKTPPIIKCIRRAHRDVLKIQKCAKLVHS
jgi:hypothetical protein